MAYTQSGKETYSEEETEERQEAALKQMLATPHKLHEKRAKAKKNRER